MEETDIMYHLFLALPKSYEVIVAALETISDEKLTIKFVKNKLIEEEILRKNTGSQKEREDTTIAFNAKFPFRCYQCDRVGHKKSQCRFRQKSKNDKKIPREKKSKEEIAEVSISFIANQEESHELLNKHGEIEWYVDSGASDQV